MKKVLFGSVSAFALVVMMSGGAMALDANVDGDGDDLNNVNATQTLGGEVTGSDSSVSNVTNSGNIDNATGDVEYEEETFNAPGVYTLQNQTGMNNAGAQGTNAAVQLNVGDGTSSNIELGPSVENRVEAEQTATGTVWDSNATVTNNNNSFEAPGNIGNTDNRTGDVTYDDQTFNAPGLYTLQNQTGMNNAATNGLNVAAQINLNSAAPNIQIFAPDAINSVAATQEGTSLVSGSNADVNNDVFQDGDLENETGEVHYEYQTFNAPGVYTLQNQTGQNNAGSQGTNLAVQWNDNPTSIQMEGDGINQVLATQTLASAVSGSGATVDNNFEPLSFGDVDNQTGDVEYDYQTFNAPGVYTLSNQTGMNNAASNGTNVSAQVNGL